MSLYLKIAGILTMLAVLILTPAFAESPDPVLSVTATTVAPVALVTATTQSAALMPGDTGTVLVTITNTLKSPGAGDTTRDTDTITSSYFQLGSASPGMTQTKTSEKSLNDLSSCAAPIKFVNLLADGPVQVLTEPQTDVGSLGCGDSITFPFKIRVDSTARDDTYSLKLKVKTDDDAVFISQAVPVVVDSTQPYLTINDAPSGLTLAKSTIVLDVVNFRSSAINAVSVLPAGEEFKFQPRDEYTVGSIGAGELYTVSFETSCRNVTYNGSPSFVVKYKNGDNWHQTAPMAVPLEKSNSAEEELPEVSNEMILGLLVVFAVGALVIVGLVAGGLYVLLKWLRAKK